MGTTFDAVLKKMDDELGVLTIEKENMEMRMKDLEETLDALRDMAYPLLCDKIRGFRKARLLLEIKDNEHGSTEG